MKNTILAISFFIFGWSAPLSAEVMTYQGRLKESNVPVNANRTFLFEFCATETPTGCVASADGAKPFAVQNGLFKSTFTMPAVDLSAGPWYLRVKVEGSYLSPVERLTFVPYSVFAASAAYAVSASSLAAVSGPGVISSTHVIVLGGLTASDIGVLSSTTAVIQGYALLKNINTGIEDVRVGVSGRVNSDSTDAVDVLAGGNFEVEVPVNKNGAMIGVRAANRNSGGSSSLSVGVLVDSLQNSGTIGDTYGVWIATLTQGGQTNKPFALYAEDPNARSYFAGNVGISSRAPAYALSVSTASGDLFWVADDGAHGAKFWGDGSGLTGVTGASGTDSTKLLKAGDTMTGSLDIQSARLKVIADTSANQYSFAAGTGTVASHLYVSTSGYVGLGITNPDVRLALPYNGYIGWDANNDGVNYNAHRIGKSITGATPLEFRNDTNPGAAGRQFSFFYVGNELFTILNGGDVGIGKTNPAARLDVAGTGNFSGSVTTLSSGTFRAVGASQFSVETSSGILVQAGRIQAPALQLTNGAAANYVLTSDAAGNASWVNPVSGALGDGWVGNEITDAGDTTLTRSGTGTGVDPYNLKLNLSNANAWTAAQTFTNGLTGSLSGAASQNILKSGDTMTGQLTNISSVTITGNGGGAYGLEVSSNVSMAGALYSANGKVGIGTTGPVSRLDIKPSADNGASGLHVRSFNSDSKYISLWRGDNGGVIDVAGPAATPPPYLGITFDGTEKVRIDSSGNVGIGTTGPSYRLHVSSGAGEAGIIMAVSTGTSVVFGVKGNGEVSAGKYFGDGSGLTNLPVPGGLVSIAGDTMIGQLTNTSSITITGNGGVYGLQVSSNVSLAGALYSANGNVGIGTTNPTSNLYVAGTGATAVLVAGANSNTNIASWSLRGDTGMNRALEFYLYPSGSVLTDFGLTKPFSALYSDVGQNGLAVFTGNGPLAFGTGGPLSSNERMRITNAGNVGIGTTNPVDLFEVAGSLGNIGIPANGNSIRYTYNGTNYIQADGALSELRIRTGGTDRMVIKTAGNIGIGTTAPATKFEVAGGSVTISGAEAGLLFDGPSRKIAPTTSITEGAGLYVSTHVYIIGFSSAAKYYGDGSALTGVSGSDVTKLPLAGGSMSGQLTNTSSVTITGNGGAYGLAVSSNVSLAGALYSANGNVGIGVTAPGTRLEVEASGPVNTALFKNSSANQNGITLQSLAGTDQANTIGFESWSPGQSGLRSKGAIMMKTGGNLVFVTSNDGNSIGFERMRIAALGNVGISTGAPEARLDVLAGGAAQTDMAQIWRNSAGTIVSSVSATGVVMATKFVGNGSGITGISATDATKLPLGGGTLTGQLTLSGSSLTVTGAVAGQNFSANGRILFSSDGLKSTDYLNPASSITIAAGYALGSGAPLPGGHLIFKSGHGNGSGFPIDVGFGGDVRILALGGNNARGGDVWVRSGNTDSYASAGQKSVIDLWAGASDNSFAGSTTGGRILLEGHIYPDGGGSGGTYVRGGHVTITGGNGTTGAGGSGAGGNIVLKPGTGPGGLGNVGISTGVPQARLDVLAGGSAQTDMAQLWRNSAGTIVSSVSATGVLMAGKFIGDGSGLSSVSATDATKLPLAGGTMVGDITMGGNDLYAVSTITATGNITAARYQIAGSTVLAILPGTGSLGVGVNAGRVNTGNTNSFLGYYAGYSNTAGSDNSFLGYYAGYSNTTGGSNSFLGSTAGGNNTTGGNNSFLGSFAGNSNTTGGNNSFLGNIAGLNTKTGSANAVFGAEAGKGVINNSFSSATIMGYQAGYGLTTGNDNILLGFQAGYNVTTGTGNIVIGYNKNTSAPAANNELNIGGLLYGDLSARTIGISTRVPQAALDIVSTGTVQTQFAQIWRDSNGNIQSSMSATGVMMASKFVGDGSGLAGVSATDNTKLPLGGGTLTGQLTLAGSTLTVTGNAFSVGGSTLVVDNGRVGIGTAGATYPFVIQTSVGTNTPILAVNSDAGTRIAYIGKGVSDDAQMDLADGTGNSKVFLDANGPSYFTGGSVGIGATAPDQKLTVAGNISQTGVLISSGTGKNYFAGDVTAARYQINGSTVVAVLPGSGSLGIGISAGEVDTGTDNSFLGYRAGYVNTSGGQNTFVGSNAGRFNTTGNTNSFFGYAAGITNTAGGDNAFFGNQTGASNTTGSKNTFMGGYAAGYGNTTGSASVIFGNEAGGAGGTGGNISSSTIMGYRAGFKLTNASDNILLGFQAGYNVTTGTGNILIGYGKDTSAPGASSELNIGGVLYGDLSARTIGISTRVPQAALDIVSTGTASNVYAQIWRDSTGAVVASMTATGRLSGDGSGLTGVSATDATKLPLSGGTMTGDITMGANDLYAVSTITATGDITAARYQINGSTVLAILPGNSLGIGLNSGRVNTISNNFFAGNLSGYANTTGFMNVFLGQESGFSNISGSNNTFTGFQSGYNTTAPFNSFFGSQSGYTNVSGSENSFFGAYSGLNNASGKYNSLFGYQAGQYNVVGGSNTIMGYNAGNGVTSNSYYGNTLMGYQAGFLLSTGSGNLLLGSQAGDSIQSGSRNIIIGYDQDVTAPGVSNQLNIGGVLYGDLSARTIGISTRVPQAALDIVSTGTVQTQFAQIWRDSNGNIQSSMSATGVMMAFKFVGDGSGLSGVTGTDNTKLPLAGGTLTGQLSVFASTSAFSYDIATNGIVISTGGAVQTVGTGYGTVMGNSRGNAAVDLQTYRTAAAQVASGPYSVVAGGYGNTASASFAFSGGGNGNSASGGYSFAGGGASNQSSNGWTTVAGGAGNIASQNYATVGGGSSNNVSAYSGTVAGGYGNKVLSLANAGFIGGGDNNISTGAYSTVGGGRTNTSSGAYSAVLGGQGNLADGAYAAVGGGRGNNAAWNFSAVAGGENNRAWREWAIVAGGIGNTADGQASGIIGGDSNKASGFGAFIGGGGYNQAKGWGAVAFGANNASMADYTFAAGKAATSAVNGTFTWADSSSEGAVNNVLDQVMFKAKGGFWVSTGTVYTDPGLFVDANNRVGIGTAVPTAKLHIGGTPGVDGIRFPDGTMMTTAGVGSASNLANITDAIINGDSDSNLTGSVRLQTAGLDRVYVSTNGNVGIGTISPSVRFHNSGSAILADITTIDPDSYGNAVIAGGFSDVGWNAYAIGGKATNAGTTWGIGHNNADLLFAAGDATNPNTLQTFMQATWKRNLALVPVSGKVGIGTSAIPDQKLTVIGSISQTGVLISSGTGNNYFAGNVGIGTDTPAAMLDVNGTARLGRYIVESRDSGGTMTAADFGKTITVNSASPQGISLPVGTAGTVGAQFTFVKLGTGKVTIQAGATDYIADSAVNGFIYNDAVSPAYATLTLRLVTSNQWMLVGGEGAWVTQ